MIPLPSDTSALPDIAPVLPDELKASDREMMILAQGSQGERDGRGSFFAAFDYIVSTPIYAKGNALDSAVRQIGP